MNTGVFTITNLGLLAMADKLCLDEYISHIRGHHPGRILPWLEHTSCKLYHTGPG